MRLFGREGLSCQSNPRLFTLLSSSSVVNEGTVHRRGEGEETDKNTTPISNDYSKFS
jgi:hypothetical protein